MPRTAVTCSRCGQPMSDSHECGPLLMYAISTIISARKHQNDPGTPALLHQNVVRAESASAALRLAIPQPASAEWPTAHYRGFAVCFQGGLTWIATIAPEGFTLF